MKPKFVTCNYTDLYGTRFNGRLNRDFIYMYSLRALANTEEPILNYTGPYNMKLVNPYLKEQGITNIESVEFPLTKSPYHARVEEIKDLNSFYYTHTAWMNRCCEIMYGKIIWMEENLEQLTAEETLYWIDCGLSQGCIIPRKFNPFNGNLNYYREDKTDLTLEYAHRHDTIFNNQLVRRLDTFSGDKLLLICSKNAQHGDPYGYTFYNKLELWPIGGLWGGKKRALLPFIIKFKEVLQRSLDKDCLVKEEAIFAVILNEHPEWFNTFAFDTWYHDDWISSGVYDPTRMTSFSKFFDNLLQL